MADLSASRLANLSVPAIVQAFDDHQAAFDEVGRRARGRFETRDWKGAVADAAERLDLYGSVLDRVVEEVRETLSQRATDRVVWAGMKAIYSGQIAGREDWELAETWFNSVTRRVFATLGVDGNIEFVDSDFEAPQTEPRAPLCRRAQLKSHRNAHDKTRAQCGRPDERPGTRPRRRLRISPHPAR